MISALYAVIMGKGGKMDTSAVNSSNVQAASNTFSAKETSKAENTKKSGTYGKTVGQPKLSEKAEKYYEELKSKYSNLDFVLVSKDMKETAKANAAGYANPHKMVVLIDEEKIERMAEDEKFRSQYEGLIASAQSNLPALKQTLGNAANVKGYGMQVNENGTASFFAVMKKSSDQMTAKLEKKRAEKKAEKKAAEKKEQKQAIEKKIQEKRSEKAAEAKGEKKAGKAEENDDAEEFRDLFGEYKNDDVEILSASSVEELLKRVEDYNFALRSDSVRTPEEMMVGSHIDFRG